MRLIHLRTLITKWLIIKNEITIIMASTTISKNEMHQLLNMSLKNGNSRSSTRAARVELIETDELDVLYKYRRYLGIITVNSKADLDTKNVP